MLLLLSHISRVQLCVTLYSPGKNTGMGCHFLLQYMKVKSKSEVALLYPTLRDPMDYSLPGSSVHGTFQARVLEWGAIAFSVLCCAKLLQSCLTLYNPMDCSPPDSSVMGFSRQEYWSGVPFPSSGDLSNPGVKSTSLMSPALAGRFFTTSTTWEAQNLFLDILFFGG